MELGMRPYVAGEVRADVGFTPDPATTFVAEVNQTVLGCGHCVWWDEADGTRLYLLLGWIDPASRGLGYGRQLLAWLEQQARDLAAADPPAGTPMFGANVAESQPDARDLLVAAGYRIAFTRVQLAKELNAVDLPDGVELPGGVELRPATAADHRALFDANADVFGDSSHGYIQDSFERFEADAAEDYPDHSLWTLAWAGDELAGWVISGPAHEGVADTPWVGIRPAWRRRGLASALLRTNHQALREHDVRTASLWTIAENPTGSVALYESLGYRITVRQPRYRKPF